MDRQVRSLFSAATRPYLKAGFPYLGAGFYYWQSARGKLRFDPVFFMLLKRGVLPGHGRLFDVGCGQGVLLSLLIAAREQYRRGEWPQDWPAPPLDLDPQGMDLRQDLVRAARRALGERARIQLRDAREAEFPRCTAIVMLDVLHYLGAGDQQRVLEKAARSLEPDGVLLVREADAGAGFPFQVTKWSERIAEAGRGRLRNSLHFRSSREWVAALEKLGLGVRVEPVSGGTPFANVLFVAKKSPTPKLKPQMNTDGRG